MKKIVLAIITLLWVSGVQAQSQHQCMTDYMTAQAIKDNPALAAKMEVEYNSAANYTPAKTKRATKYVIPVVFHVIHNYGPENISKEQILDQIRVINEDFSRTNADAINTRAQFLGVAADMEIEFRLATKDPDGNCTDGIVRVASESTYEARDNVKSLSRWPNEKYLNIWIVSSIRDTDGDPSTTTLGYAYLPGSVGIGSTRDGIVMIADRVGTIGTSSKAKAGRVLTHEIGHYLGLLHPFQGGCGSSCNSSGDYICDTPPVSAPSFGCDKNKTSCGQTTQIENFMDYASGSCANMFTAGQKALAEFYFQTNAARENIIKESNLIATGTDDNAVVSLCAPKADFHSDYKFACSGTTVYFENHSWRGDATSYEWTFEGATPPTSTDENPGVVYDNPGTYKVTLKATNATGSDEVTKEAYIEIAQGVADFKGPIIEGFESATFDTDGEPWVTQYENDEPWERFTNASYSGDACYRVANNATVPEGTKFTFVTPTMDLSTFEGQNPKISFRYAYSRRTSTDVDIFRVYISTDCGRTWIQRSYRTGSLLATIEENKPFYTPAGQEDWELVEISLSSFDDATNLAVKFELEGNRGNNLYLDDINISNYTSSVPVISNDVLDLTVYPNPTEGASFVTYHLDNSYEDVSLGVYDVYGKQVVNIFTDAKQPAGTYKFNVNDQSVLPKGIYFIKIDVNGTQATQKLVVL